MRGGTSKTPQMLCATCALYITAKIANKIARERQTRLKKKTKAEGCSLHKRVAYKYL
jgi:hypothetical protein